MQKKRTPPPTGIYERHSRTCGTNNGGDCDCEPSYRAMVYDPRTLIHEIGCASRGGGRCDCSPKRGAQRRKKFSGKGALAAAKRWRIDALSQKNRGQLPQQT